MYYFVGSFFLRKPSILLNRIEKRVDFLIRVASNKMSTGAEISKRKHKVAICQLTCSDDKNDNFKIARKLIVEAKQQGAEMVFLPENSDFIESTSQATYEKSEPLDGKFIENFKKLTAELNLWISIGSYHRKVENDSKIHNSHVVIDNKGEIRCVNDKIHLFEVNLKTNEKHVLLKEADTATRGKLFYMPLETPIGSISTSICFDLRFPQLSSIMRSLGAQILTYPSAFTVPTGQAHWEVLLRARAIETQCYVIAAAQVGQHNEKRASYGYSMIVDPWGKVIANCEEESPSVRVAEIDLDYLDQVRHSIPIQNSIRQDLYLQLPIIQKNIEQDFYSFSTEIRIPKETIFYESKYCVASVNIKPIVPGHVLIIPKEIRLRVADMLAEEAIDLFYIARLIGEKLEKYYNATALNFSIQDGIDSGQTVNHVHLHILPRRKGDFRKDEIYDKLKTHDKDPRVDGRSLEAMAAEAAELRKLFLT